MVEVRRWWVICRTRVTQILVMVVSVMLRIRVLDASRSRRGRVVLSMGVVVRVGLVMHVLRG